jgi:hypothetical protein
MKTTVHIDKHFYSLTSVKCTNKYKVIMPPSKIPEVGCWQFLHSMHHVQKSATHFLTAINGINKGVVELLVHRGFGSSQKYILSADATECTS